MKELSFLSKIKMCLERPGMAKGQTLGKTGSGSWELPSQNAVVTSPKATE